MTSMGSMVRMLRCWRARLALTIDTALDPDVSVLVADSTVSGVEVSGVGLKTDH